MNKEISKNEKVFFDFLVWLAIIITTGFLLTKAYKGLRRGEDMSSLLLFFGAILISVGLSCAFKFKTNLKSFFFISLIIYFVYPYWCFRRSLTSGDDTLIIIFIVNFLTLIIYGIYYSIKVKKSS